MQAWQLHHAKNRFSEVVDRALAEGPQMVTRRGKQTVVILAAEEYQKLMGADTNLAEFFRSSPLVGADLDLTRDPDRGSNIEL